MLATVEKSIFMSNTTLLDEVRGINVKKQMFHLSSIPPHLL